MVIIILGFILGTVLGSFTKVLADRSLEKKSLSGRSHCTNCQHTLAWYDLVPIFSYLLLGGRCRYCRHKLGPEYLLIEVLTGCLVALLFSIQFPSQVLTSMYMITSPITFLMSDYGRLILETIFKLFIIIVLVSVFITDLRTSLIPDRISLPAIKIAFGFLILYVTYRIAVFYLGLRFSSMGRYLMFETDYFVRNSFLLTEPLIGGILAALFLALFFGALIYFTKGRGMGGGDLKLGIFMGFALGFPAGLIAMFIAFFAGSIAGVGLLLFRRKKIGQTIPFGPFLVLGSLLMLFYGNQITQWYLNLRL